MPDELTIVKSWDAPEPDAKPSPFGARTATAEESRMLDEIKRRESSNNYAAKNRDSTASGAYQFINSTWRLASHETKAPYYGTAAEARPEVQDQNALHMLRKYGPNATITWAESGPYGTGKSKTSRNATAPAQASAAPTGNASADDLIARLAGGENVEITPQVIAQIIQGPKTEPAKPAAEPAPLTIVKRWDAPPPAKPPEPSPLSKTATAFMEGSKPLIDMMSLIQAGHDPVSAIQAGQTVKDIALTLWNERGRWWREVKQAVQSAQRGDVAATQQHTAGAIPLLGPAIQQIQQDIRRGDPAAAVGHGGALAAPLIVDAAMGPLVRSVEAGIEAGTTAVPGAVRGAYAEATAPSSIKIKGTPIELPVPRIVSTAAGGATVGKIVGGPPGTVVGGAIGAVTPIVRGAVKGARRALAEGTEAEAAAAQAERAAAARTARQTARESAMTAAAEADARTAAQGPSPTTADLWEKVQKGDVTQNGQPSPLLQTAKTIRDRGGLQTPEDFAALRQDFEQRTTANTQGLVEEYSPQKPAAPTAEQPPAESAPETPAAQPQQPTRTLGEIQTEIKQRLTTIQDLAKKAQTNPSAKAQAAIDREMAALQALKNEIPIPPGTVPPPSAAPETPAVPQSPGQAYAAANGIDWHTLSTDDQIMLEHRATAPQPSPLAQQTPAEAQAAFEQAKAAKTIPVEPGKTPAEVKADFEARQRPKAEESVTPPPAAATPPAAPQNLSDLMAGELPDIKQPGRSMYTETGELKSARQRGQEKKLANIEAKAQRFSDALTAHGMDAADVGKIKEGWVTAEAMKAGSPPGWENVMHDLIAKGLLDKAEKRAPSESVPRIMELMQQKQIAKPATPQNLSELMKQPESKAPKLPKASAKEPTTMTAGEINKALDKLDAQDSALTQEFIDAGRGNERPSDIRKKTDPLATRYKALQEQRSKFRIEIELRYGPGAPSRLPKGFGPRKPAR